MPLRDDIQQAQTAALKARDAARLSTLRMLWSAIRTEEINQQAELSDEGIVAVVSRQLKQLRDSLADFERGGRDDLVAQARVEMQLLEAYLPAQLSDSDLETVVKRVITQTGVADQSGIGRVMGMVMKEVQGKADGTRVRVMVTRLLP